MCHLPGDTLSTVVGVSIFQGISPSDASNATIVLSAREFSAQTRIKAPCLGRVPGAGVVILRPAREIYHSIIVPAAIRWRIW